MKSALNTSALLLMSMGAANGARSPGTGIEVKSGFNVQVRLDEDDPSQAIFEVYMKDGTWMGLVLGDVGMAPGSDMIQIKANGTNSRVYDKFSTGYISPPIDSDKNLQATFRFFEGGFIRFTIKRALDTGDSQNDFLLPLEKSFELGWAVNSDTNNLLKKHNSAGGLTAVLYTDYENAFERTDAFEGAMHTTGLAMAAFGTLITAMLF